MRAVVAHAEGQTAHDEPGRVVSDGSELFCLDTDADLRTFSAVADQLSGVARLIPSASLELRATDRQLKAVAAHHVSHPGYEPMPLLSLV
jgi:hypothetical protein